MSKPSGKLRLGPLPKSDTVKLTVALPADLKATLDRYAELHASMWGESVDAAALVPHMLSAFMERDRGFRSLRRAPGTRPVGPAKAADAQPIPPASPSA